MSLIGAHKGRRALTAVLVAVAAVLAFAVGGYHAHDLPGAKVGYVHVETDAHDVLGSAGCPACTLAHVSAPVPGPDGVCPPEIVSAPATIDNLRAPVLAAARHVSSRAPPLFG
jgi:hypothetical protein